LRNVGHGQVFFNRRRHPPDCSFMSEIHDDDAWFDMEVTSADYEPAGPSPAVLHRRRIVLAVALGSSGASVLALIAMATIVLRAPARGATMAAAPEPAAAPVPAPVEPQAAPGAVPPAPPLPASALEVTMPVDPVAPTPRRRAVRSARVAHAPAALPMLRKLREATFAPMVKIAPASAHLAPPAPAPAKPHRYGHFN
jgi:hypothetical protein